jgi:hypothetical protein
MMSEGVEPSRVTFDIMLRASCVANAPNRFYELTALIAHHNIELRHAHIT